MAVSRRTFSALAGTAALGLALGGSGGTGASSAYAARESPAGPPPPEPSADGRRHSVGFDRYSLLVDGRRLVLWSGETHPFRLPSPSLWRDVLEKTRAHGYNAVGVRVAWNHHSPAPGTYDFTGVRDLDLFLRTAADAGLYVLLRPGPHIGADVDGGGLPGWLAAAEGSAREADPAYLAHVDEWLGRVNAIVSRHLFTRGGGTVLLYQLGDGYGPDEPAGRDAYLSHLRDKVRADGIDVPLFQADGSFENAGAGAPGFVPDAVGGRPDPWGGAPSGGRGYAQVRRVRGAAAERRDRLTDLARGVTLHNTYLAFGGTSWGWLPAPDVYTSYDYGAALDEGRQPTEKLTAAHQIGHMLRSIPDFAALERAADVKVPGLTAYHLKNPASGAHVHVLRNDGGKDVSAKLPAGGERLPVTVPAGDARLAVTGLRLGQRRLRFTTAQPMLFLSAGRQDVAVFCGAHGEMVRVGLEARQEPLVTRLSPQAAYVYDDNRALLRVTVPVGAGGLIGVRVEDDGIDRPLLMLFADEKTSVRLWPRETPQGALLVCGPRLLRGAALSGSTAELTGDTVEAARLEVWGPAALAAVTWNGRPVRTIRTGSGSLRSTAALPGVPKVELPALGGWRRRTENPESEPDFDDSTWRVAAKKSSYSTTAVPEGQPVLFADDHGFHYGDVWYRGAFTDATGIESVSLTHRGGTQGLLMAWLDGEPLGTHRMPVPGQGAAGKEGKETWTATAVLPVRSRLRTGGRHVLSVLVRPMAHAQGGGPAGDSYEDTYGNAYKAARGLTSVTFGGGGAGPEVRWRVQGQGVPDPVRGPLNNGGLYGEREGWHLPGFADGDWEPVSFPRTEWRQGVIWYRTAFRLAVPEGVDASVGLTLEDDPERAYRAQIFLNGWNMGQYVNDVGPQHTFALPDGILRSRGANTLALAVLSGDTSAAGPGRVRLTLLGGAAGGVPVAPVSSPGR
ncbi:beta-galactosidase [Streptomyces sp. NPDC047017]|uniref:beta-galactosidase n=1 Tax=Streptomyces sp. NPDC047017 TaxID=3155024 RepID=UPI0033FE04DF